MFFYHIDHIMILTLACSNIHKLRFTGYAYKDKSSIIRMLINNLQPSIKPPYHSKLVNLTTLTLVIMRNSMTMLVKGTIRANFRKT